MNSTATADVVRADGRHASDVVEQRPRQNVYDDVAREAADALGARAERPIETPVAPVGRPEYTGRA